MTGWVEGTKIGILDPACGANVTDPRTQIIYINFVYAEDPILPNVWTTIDAGKTFYGVDNGMPLDAEAIWLSGILIISPGYSTATADLQFYVRKPGAAPHNPYMCAQVIANSPIDGARTNFCTCVPVVDRKFEMMWNRSTPGFWPNNPSYGIIAWPVAYLR